MSQATYPLVVYLPDGSQARMRIIHVAVKNERGKEELTQLVNAPPQYERRDGTTVELDVTLPSDLVPHWFWFGSALVSDDGLILISTTTYPPSGIESARGSCFDMARQLEAGTQRRALGVARPDRVQAPAKSGEPVQLALELV